MGRGFGQLLPEEDVEAAVAEYELNVAAVDAEFKERTRLQDKDAAFVIAATALQVLRIVLVQSMRPDKQPAGKDNDFEAMLKKRQQDALSRFDDTDKSPDDRLRASLHHIVTSRGVPYDATRYADAQLKELGLLRGANHRFMTLGHDPLLGIVFGTSNILTNTITTNRKASLLRLPVIRTHPVKYDPVGKNPVIQPTINPYALTIEMLRSAAGRLVDDKPSVCAALIKQIIHIGTDIYTPCGIQLPLSGLVLSNGSVEKLTAYVGTAEVVEFGASASLSVLINWLIASLHGCTLLFDDDGTDYCCELYQARTRKILSLSNIIASTSSLIATAVKPDVVRLDLGGLAVTLFRLVTDAAFITRLKYEYLNSEVSKIYERRGEGLVEADWLDEEACLERLGLK